jgi:hypothetical protein
MRGKDYGLLDLAQVKERLALPADEQLVHPESGVCRDLFECGELPVTAEGHRSRVIIATHPAGTAASPIGVTREGVVYELFFTALPALGFTAADVVKLYWYVHEKTSSCQCCPASTTEEGARSASASLPFCPSSHPVGGLVTHSASPSLDPLAAKPPGHRGSFTRFATCAGYIGYPAGTLQVNLFRYLVL